MALPVNTPAESTLNLGAVPSMLARTADVPIALTSAGNIGEGVAMRNPTMAQTESGLDALTGAGLGGMIGMLLDRNNKPSTTTNTTALFSPKTNTNNANANANTNANANANSGSTGNLGSVNSVQLPAGTDQAAIDAKYGLTNGQSNYVISGVNTSNGNVVAIPNYNIGGANLTGTGSATGTQTEPSGGGYTPPTNYLTAGYLQDGSGNLYVDNGDGTATLMYESIGNTNYVYQGPQYTSSSGTDIYSGSIMDQLGNQVAPNWNWYVSNSADTSGNTSTDTDNTDWSSWYGSNTDTSNTDNTANTDYWTYIDTTGGPSWKQGGLATPLYAKGGEVKGYADGDLVTTTDITANPTALASATPTSFTDQVVANQLGTGATNTAASATDTTGGTTSPLSSITDLLQQHSGISGAVIGALLGQLLGGKSSGNVNTGVDMSKIAQITPRTTNFGIGPSNFAPYTAYGTSPGTSPAYGGLYSNLGVSGYGSNANPLLARRISTGASPFYTFGSPVDPSKYMAEGGSVDEPHMADGGDMLGAPGSAMPTPSALQLAHMGTPSRTFSGVTGNRVPSGALNNYLQTWQRSFPGAPAPALNQLNTMLSYGASSPFASSPYRSAYASPARSRMYGYAEGGQTEGMQHNLNIPQMDGVNPNVPKIGHRNDYRKGSYVEGPGDGQSDDIPAMLADGEYVIDAETVAQLGNGSNKAGAKILDKFRENIRAHKRSAPHDKIPPKAKAPLAYLKGTK